jgi:hypothetical protein
MSISTKHNEVIDNAIAQGLTEIVISPKVTLHIIGPELFTVAMVKINGGGFDKHPANTPYDALAMVSRHTMSKPYNEIRYVR